LGFEVGAGVCHETTIPLGDNAVGQIAITDWSRTAIYAEYIVRKTPGTSFRKIWVINVECEWPATIFLRAICC
jgi:hypothetical protein